MSEPTKGLRLYNTLTRTKEDFAPIDPQNVRMYVCGPTVYDYAHIGNARPVIVFDVLFRLLKHLYPGKGSASDGSRVTYVRNITDVDDKINARALRDFGAEIASGKLSLNQAIRNVTEKTAKQFHEDVKALGCLDPTAEPRATDFVLPRPDGKANMAELIQSLIDRGHAYEANGEILFDVASMKDYGQLSKRNLDEQQAGARIAVDADKRNPADFVLWKQSSTEEPGWDATFEVEGKRHAIRGRPGWHIECSAMSAAYLGDVFDIHGGGLDLIFPHHENEIAQSRCAHGTPLMAKYWLHNGFLQVEGRKMSKSEGNFVTIHELLATEKFGGRKWPGEVLRLAMLMTHYREPIDFSVRRLEEAFSNAVQIFVAAWSSPQSEQPDGELLGFLKDDLNTPAAIARLGNLAREHAPTLAASLVAMGIELHDEAFRKFLILKRRVGQSDTKAEAELEAEVLEQLGIDRGDLMNSVNARLAFIRDKNWAEADRIRDDLLKQGIQLKDGKDPATGERITTWEVKR